MRPPWPLPMACTRLRSVMAAVGHQSGSLAEGDHEFSVGAGGQCRRGGTKIGASGGGATLAPWTAGDGPKLGKRRGQWIGASLGGRC